MIFLYTIAPCLTIWEFQAFNSAMRHDISFDNHNTIRSNQFGDIYFSPVDGIAETSHVFLAGNALPQAWRTHDQFTIGETGFGTGLNILCAWQLFEETAQSHQRLDCISLEKYPLKKEEITRALSPFKKQFGDKIDRLLHQYPLLIPGFHRLWLSDRVTLTLIFDDAVTGLAQVDCPVDAWFFDGFAPAKNPEMWSSALFQEIARLSHNTTTFATFTAAGAVKRGLQNVGFTVEKIPGFGRKREMLTGRYRHGEKPIPERPQKIAIIGAGLAGAAMAYCLKRRGIDVTVFEEKEAVSLGSSSNHCALINPKLYADAQAPQTQLSSSGYSFALSILKELDDIDFAQTGNIHLANTTQKITRFEKYVKNLNWDATHMQPLKKADIKEKTGLQTKYDGIFYMDAAMVNPQKLVHAYLKNIDIHLNQKVMPKDLSSFDTVIIANGIGALDMPELSALPLKKIRGQVTYIKLPEGLQTFPHSIGYGGYISAPYNGVMVVGSSFDHEEESPIIKDKDDEDNLAALKSVLPDFATKLEIVDHWAGMRCGSKDYLPVIGKLPGEDNLYTLVGLGSYGVIGSLIGAELLASDITKIPSPLGQDTKKALSPQRFLDRDFKKAILD